MSHNQTTEQEQQQQSEPAARIPDPEVVLKAKRRQFSAEYKRRILQEADACTEPGQIGALLRREGLYSSYLFEWRRQRAQGERHALSAQQRGRKPADKSVAELVQLRGENEHLRARLEQAEMIIDVQKKLSQLLGLSTDKTASDGSRP
jgi:transposase-like protein